MNDVRPIRKQWFLIVLGLGCGAILWAAPAGSARESSTSRSTKSEKTADLNLRPLEAKLDEVIANQQQIIQKFDAVMEELRVIKVRTLINN